MQYEHIQYTLEERKPPEEIYRDDRQLHIGKGNHIEEIPRL